MRLQNFTRDRKTEGILCRILSVPGALVVWRGVGIAPIISIGLGAIHAVTLNWNMSYSAHHYESFWKAIAVGRGNLS